MNKEIKSFLEENDIKYLYHFTKLDNLKSILDNGLMSRKALDDMKFSYLYNDNYRLDAREDTVSVSISFPNYRMFYKYREADRDVVWCVIKLDAKILYEKECIFCMNNAASYDVTRTDIRYKLGIDGLRRMFYNDELRKRLNQKINWTTNPQAEVLVKDKIEPEYIIELCFDVKKIKFPIDLYKDRFNFSLANDLFRARNDYEYWR